MHFSKLTITIVFFGMFFAGILQAQTVQERKSYSETESRALPDDNLSYPLHVSDILLQLPESVKALEELSRLYEMKKQGHEVMVQVLTDPEVGDRRTFKVYNFEESEGSSDQFDDIEMELRAIGELAEIWVEVDELGEDKITQQVVDVMMQNLEVETPARSVNSDQGIVENNRELFGNPPNVDGSGRVKVLLVNIRDGWDPDEGGGFTAGFFHPVDLSQTNPNSNRADIIYINTYPGIYTETRPANPLTRLSTIAHEHQHLIHANPNYRALNLFQNEGQSELAEVLNGYDARGMSFLNLPEEVSGMVTTVGLYRWRTGQSEVTYDYQRAGLLHAYLSERVGPQAAGSLTRAASSGRPGYQSILNAENIEFENFITEFYVANWVNSIQADDRFGYEQPQLRGVRVSNPAVSYSSASEATWVFNREVRIRYGGAKYTHWFGVQDLEVNVKESESGLYHYVVSSNGEDYSIQELTPGIGVEFDGIHESVTLISVNARADGSENNPGSRVFVYDADWDRTTLAQKDITYNSRTETIYYIELFGDNPDAIAFSMRIDPDESGHIRNLKLSINNRPQGIEGDGMLRATLTTSRVLEGSGADELRIPDNGISYVEIPFSNLAPGEIFLDVSGWEVQRNVNYHVLLEIRDGTPDSRIEFLLDNGTANRNNADYYPVRMLIFQESNGQNRVAWFNNSNNLLLTYQLVYADESLPRLPDSDPPYAETFEIEPNYPNPFNPETHIRYNLPEAAHVRIDVYDMLGRRIATLIDEEQPIGSYTLPFNAEGLASGMYIYRMQAGDFTGSHKMLLLR